MVRSLAQWTKSLSFPSRLSPNRNSKDCSGVNIHQVNPPPPTPPRNNKSHNSSSPSPSHNNNNIPITEINQIVSFCPWFLNLNLLFIYKSLPVSLKQRCFSGDFRGRHFYCGAVSFSCSCSYSYSSSSWVIIVFWIGKLDMLSEHVHFLLGFFFLYLLSLQLKVLRYFFF